MVKKDTVVIAACVVLFALLIALLFFERQNPNGGVKFVASLLGRISGH